MTVWDTSAGAAIVSWPLPDTVDWLTVPVVRQPGDSTDTMGAVGPLVVNPALRRVTGIDARATVQALLPGHVVARTAVGLEDIALASSVESTVITPYPAAAPAPFAAIPPGDRATEFIGLAIVTRTDTGEPLLAALTPTAPFQQHH